MRAFFSKLTLSCQCWPLWPSICCEWPFNVIKHELLTHEYYIALQFLQSTWSKVMNLHLRVDFFFFDAILQYFVFTHIWTSYTLDLQQYRFITHTPPIYKECIFLFMLKYVLLHSQHGAISSKKNYVLICIFEFLFWTWKVTKTVKYPKYITTAAMHFTGWLHSKAHSIYCATVSPWLSRPRILWS